MADLAKGQLRRKRADLILALDGRMEEHHRFLLAMQLRRLEAAEQDIAALDERTAVKLEPYRVQHALLMLIPGVDWVVAAVLIAEIGVDMSVFLGVYHLAAWAGVCPGNHESAGKRRAVGPGRATSTSAPSWSAPRSPPRAPRAATSRTSSTARRAARSRRNGDHLVAAPPSAIPSARGASPGSRKAAARGSSSWATRSASLRNSPTLFERAHSLAELGPPPDRLQHISPLFDPRVMSGSEHLHVGEFGLRHIACRLALPKSQQRLGGA